MKRTHKLSRNLSLAAAALLMATQPASAANFTWTANTTAALSDWNNATNWDSTPTFSNANDFVFNSDTGGASSFLGTNKIINGLTFGDNLTNTNSATYRIITGSTSDGGTARTLGFQGTNPFITVGSMAGVGHVYVGSFGDGVVNIGAANFTVTVNSTDLTKTLTFDSVVGQTGGTQSITKNGVGVLRFNRANTFAGGVNINEGVVIANSSPTSLGTGAVNLGAVAGSANATLQVSANIGNTITVNTGNGTRGLENNTSTSSGGYVMSSNVTLNKDLTSRVADFGDGQHHSLGMSGNITGAGGIVQTGNGTLILSGTNSYTGNTTVNAGMVDFRNTAARPGTGTVTVGASGGLGLGVGGGGFSSGDVDSLWANTLSGVTMDAASRVGIDTTAGNFTYSTAQSTRGLTKLGNNTLTLDAANTYTGETTIYGGTLAFSGAGALADSVRVYVARNASFDISGISAASETIGSLASGTTSGNLTTDATTTVVLGAKNLTMGGDNSSTSFAGVISGTGGITKVGTGTLALSNANTFNGTSTISAGTVQVSGSNQALGTGAAANLLFNGGNLTYSEDANRNIGQGRLFTFAADTTITVDRATAGNGTGITHSGAALAIGTNTLTITAGNNVTSGQIGYNVSAITLTGNATFQVNNNSVGGSIQFNPTTQVISGTGFGFTKTGNGTFNTNGNNTFTGVLNLNEGILRTSNGVVGALGNGTLVLNGGELQLASLNTTVNYLRNTTLGGNATVRIENTSAGGVGLARNFGNLTVSGDRKLTVYSQGLQTSGADLLTFNATTLNGNAEFEVNASTANVTTTLQLGAIGETGGARNLTKSGNGTLNLAGTNTYTGNTSVNAGTLQFNAASLSDSADVRLATNATLNLNFSGNDTVHALYIDNVPQTNGTWGGTGSGAAHESAIITGTGWLDVTTSGAVPANVTFTTSSQSVAESAGTAILTVQATGTPTGTITANVTYDSGNSTASAGDIGSYTTQTVTLNATNSYTANVTVTITDDAAPEGNEIAVFDLTDLTGSAVLASPSTHTLTILTNDSFATWAATYNVTNSLAANDDADKFLHGEEYAYDLDPTVKEYGNVLGSTTSLSGGNVTMTLAFSGNSAKQDINYVVRRANNPGFTGNTVVGQWNGTANWTTSNGTYFANQTQSGAGDVKAINVNMAIPAATEPRQFLKVEIE